MTQIWYDWKTRSRVFFINIVTIGLFALIGAVVDWQFFPGRHLGLIAGVIISFPFTVVVLKKTLRKRFSSQSTNISTSNA